MAGRMKIVGLGDAQQQMVILGAAAAGAVAAWYAEAAAATWRSPLELAARFPTALLSPPDFVLFNLDEAGHCALARVNYGMQLMLVTFLGKKEAVAWPPAPPRATRARK